MRTFIKVSVLFSERLRSLQDTIDSLCATIEIGDNHTCYFPSPGNLFIFIQLLRNNGIQYEIDTIADE
jgi:hypothetical protein